MGFLQMGAAQKDRVQHAVSSSSQLDDFQRESVLDFLQGKQTAQSSGEITGMLKAMLEEMEGDLKSATADEASAAKSFSELSAAKSAEIAAATSAIESETKAFLADLGKQCAAKKAAWGERQAMRAEEIRR